MRANLYGREHPMSPSRRKRNCPNPPSRHQGSRARMGDRGTFGIGAAAVSRLRLTLYAAAVLSAWRCTPRMRPGPMRPSREGLSSEVMDDARLPLAERLSARQWCPGRHGPGRRGVPGVAVLDRARWPDHHLQGWRGRWSAIWQLRPPAGHCCSADASPSWCSAWSQCRSPSSTLSAAPATSTLAGVAWPSWR